MLGHLLVGALQARLVAARLGDAALELVEELDLAHFPACRIDDLGLLARVVDEELLARPVDLALERFCWPRQRR